MTALLPLLIILGGVAYIAQWALFLRLVQGNAARRNGWTPWHVISAQILLPVAIFLGWEAWADIFSTALNDEESSHIFLVPIIFAWLVWVRRERLRQCTPGGAMIGPMLILFAWGISSYGYYNSVQSFWHAGAVVLLIGCLLTAAGKDMLVRFLPAFSVLAFLVPVPGFVRRNLAIPLQAWLAQITQHIFDLIGIEIVRTGNMLEINGQPVAIAEACNGLRMVFALVLVSYAFAFGTPLRPYVRLLIIAASPVAALFCNIVRMIPTVWLYGRSGDMFLGIEGKSIADIFHELAGWVMLVVAFLLLMGIIRVLRWAMIPVTRYTLAYD